jgi:hypothetical protein
VFGYIGGGDHLYVGGVSKRWRGRYLQYCVQNGTAVHSKKLVTRHRSVLKTKRGLQLALASGLSVQGWVMSTQPFAEMTCKHSL